MIFVLTDLHGVNPDERCPKTCNRFPDASSRYVESLVSRSPGLLIGVGSDAVSLGDAICFSAGLVEASWAFLLSIPNGNHRTLTNISETADRVCSC